MALGPGSGVSRAWLVADSGGMTGGDDGAGPDAGLGRRWDVALSFAGAQRDYVGQVAAALKARGVRCFYDADEQVRLWGTHLAEELPRIYAEESAAVVVFISADYAGGTRLERRAALARAVAEAGVYVLPARFDDSEMPGCCPTSSPSTCAGTPGPVRGLGRGEGGRACGHPAGRPAARGGPAGGVAAGRGEGPVRAGGAPAGLPEDPQPGLPELPAYVPREHDRAGRVVRAAADGHSGIAVLVGGSSTGKTRACWEALGLLRDQARTVAAVASDRPVPPRCRAARAAAHRAADGGVAERGPALPRRGRRRAGRAGRRRAAGAAAGPGPRPGAGAGHAVAAVLGHPDRPPGRAAPTRMRRRGSCWPATTLPCPPRSPLRSWASSAGRGTCGWSRRPGAADGQVIQFLAGAPELLARYRNAPPAAAALISAAMDARRLGMGVGLPRAFLEAAAPGYLTDTEWDALGEDWLEQALAYTGVPCKGIRGPLTRIRPRPARSGRQPGSGTAISSWRRPGQRHGRAAVPAGGLPGPARPGQHRKGQIPPAEFWAAAARSRLPRRPGCAR